MKKLNLKPSASFAISVIIVFLIVFSIGCAKKEKEGIKIGAILPLTGDAAQWGIPPMKGAQLAVDEINNMGGINGKKIVLKIEDDRCDPNPNESEKIYVK